MAWISFEPIALPPGFFTFNQTAATLTSPALPRRAQIDTIAALRRFSWRQKHERVTLLASLSSHY